MANLTVTKYTIAGVAEPTLVAAAAAGDEFENDGKTTFIVDNAGGGAVVVTIVGQRTLPLSTASTKTVSVGAGLKLTIGPFPTQYYNNQARRVQVTYDQVATVTVAPVSASDEFN